MRKFKGLSLAEMLIAMSIIGILAIAMLSVNNFNSYKVKATQQKISQADSALHTWAKKVLALDETGLGARGKISSADDLKDSLLDNLDLQSISEPDENNKIHLVLSNGINVTVTYNEPRSPLPGQPADFLSNVAIIDIHSGIKGIKDEQYVLAPDMYATNAEIMRRRGFNIIIPQFVPDNKKKDDINKDVEEDKIKTGEENKTN